MFNPFGFSSYVGFEIVEDIDLTSAYHHVLERLNVLENSHRKLRRVHLRTIEQVDDNFKPSDANISTLAIQEEEHRHSEAMAKTKGGEKKIA